MWPYLVGAAVVTAVAAGIAYLRGNTDSGAKESAKRPLEPHQPLRRPEGFSSVERHRLNEKPPRGPAKPSESGANRRASAGPTDDGARVIQTTKRHLWLLDLTVGDVVTSERLATELGIELTLGWHADRSITLAVLVEPGRFYAKMSGPRLRISPTDYRAASMPPISHQAVPILSACDDGWRFEGFFRFGHPKKSSIACDLIDGAPPELLDLKNGSGDGGN